MKNHATSHARFHRMPFAAALAVAIVSGRHTFTTWRLWKNTDKLLPSDLIGPVRRLHEFPPAARGAPQT